MLRVLYGGGGSSLVMRHPERVGAYPTVANGWAQAVEPTVDEVAVRFEPGNPHSFAGWVLGTPTEVSAWLLTRTESWLRQSPSIHGQRWEEWRDANGARGYAATHFGRRCEALARAAEELVPGAEAGPEVRRWRAATALMEALSSGATPERVKAAMAAQPHWSRTVKRILTWRVQLWLESGCDPESLSDIVPA